MEQGPQMTSSRSSFCVMILIASRRPRRTVSNACSSYGHEMQLIHEGGKAYGKDFFLQELGWDERILPENYGSTLAE